MQSERCLGCMNEFDASLDQCPHCGYVRGTPAKSRNHLTPGTMVGRYLIGRCLGQGGFGITYIAWDTRLYKKVAIKEFMPVSLASRITGQADITCYNDEAQSRFQSGIDRVIDESRRLAGLDDFESVVKVYDCFKANGTAYIIMELLEGENAKVILEQNGTMEPAEVRRVMTPVLRALREIHATKHMIHRDISPDNIFLCNNGKVKLLDFGSARVVTGVDNKTLSVILKPGYAPQEQYSSSAKQGPYTDVYAVCATIYKMLTGVTPIDSLARAQEDELQPLDQLANVSHAFSRAIMHGMAIQAEDRPQTVDPILEALERLGEDAPAAKRASAHKPAKSGAQKPNKPKKAFPWKKALIAGAAVLVVGGGTFAVHQTHPEWLDFKKSTATVSTTSAETTTEKTTDAGDYTSYQTQLLQAATLETLPTDKVPQAKLYADFQKKYADSRTYDAEEGMVCRVYTDAKGNAMLRERIELPDKAEFYTLFGYTKDGLIESKVTYRRSDAAEDEEYDPQNDVVVSAERYFYNKDDNTLFAVSYYDGTALDRCEIFDYNLDGTPASMTRRSGGKTASGVYDYNNPSCITLELHDETDENRKTYDYKEYTSDGKTEENWYISGSEPAETVVREKTADGRNKSYTKKLAGRVETVYRWSYKDGDLTEFAAQGRDSEPVSKILYLYEDGQLKTVKVYDDSEDRLLWTLTPDNGSYEVFDYNGDGQITTCVKYDASGKSVESWKYNYNVSDYDIYFDCLFVREKAGADKSTVLEIWVDNETIDTREERDSQGRKTKQLYYVDNSVANKYLYSYKGSNENPIRIEYYQNGSSEPDAYADYEYDSNYNWTKQTFHYSDGTVERIEHRKSILDQDWHYTDGKLTSTDSHIDEIETYLY